MAAERTHDLGRVVAIVPVFNNETTLVELTARLLATLDLVIGARVLFVDDGGTDGSWALIEAAAESDPRVGGLRLGANVRQVRAFCAGVGVAEADTVLTVDADLEVLPEALTVLIEAAASGHDFVNGRRLGRRRSTPLRAVASLAFNAMVGGGRRYGVRDLGSGATAMSREVAAAVVDATARRPTQIVKPQMVWAAHSAIEVDLPSGPSRDRSGYSARQLAWFAVDYLRSSRGAASPAGQNEPVVRVAGVAGWVQAEVSGEDAPRR